MSFNQTSKDCNSILDHAIEYLESIKIEDKANKELYLKEISCTIILMIKDVQELIKDKRLWKP